MKPKEIIVVSIIFALLATIFFYKTFLLGLVPFPGDLLVSEHKPWQSYSYLGYNPGTVPNKAQYFDVLRQLYPWKTLAIDLFKKGEFSLWNPYNFSGSPLLANFQSAVFYPLNLLYLVLPQITAWTILVILQPFLASFFTYLFARKIGIGKIGSLFASLAFSYSLFMTVFLEYNTIGQTIAWLPLSLYLVEKLLEKTTFWRLILFVASLVFSFFAGHLQIFGFSLVFIAIYIFSRIRGKNWVSFAFLLVLSLGISALQLFPTLELVNSSARVAQSYQFLIEKLLIQPSQVILFLSPDFFGNPATRNYLIPDTYPGNAVYISLPAIIFALFSIINFRKDYFVRFFLIASILLLTLFIRSPLTEIFYRFQIPLVSTGSPTNAIFLLSFSLAILSGFGIDQWFKKKINIYRLILLLPVALFFLIWLIIFLFHPQIISLKNFLYSTGILVVFVVLFFAGEVFVKRKNLLALVILLVSLFDLFYFFHKFNPFVSQRLVFPEAQILAFLKEKAGINRFWGYGTARIEANFATQYKLFSPDGYDPLYPRRYGEFIQASGDGKMKTEFTNQTRSDAIIAPGFGEEDLPLNPYRLRVLDVLGVKYILDRSENASTEKTFPKERFKLIYEKDGWRIFENLASSPRAFLTSDYKVFEDNKEFEKIFFAKEFNPSKTILLEENIVNFVSQKDSNEENKQLNLLSYTPNKVVFNTQIEKQQLLFLSDSYYSGWKVFVDGREGKIYRADYAFQAVVIPEGSHQIAFQYLPQSFSLGKKISIISLIGFLILALWMTRKHSYS